MTKKVKEELTKLKAIVKDKKNTCIMAKMIYDKAYKIAADADAELNVFKNKHGIK
jgi:hypothetical protein